MLFIIWHGETMLIINVYSNGVCAFGNVFLQEVFCDGVKCRYRTCGRVSKPLYVSTLSVILRKSSFDV